MDGHWDLALCYTNMPDLWAGLLSSTCKLFPRMYICEQINHFVLHWPRGHIRFQRLREVDVNQSALATMQTHDTRSNRITDFSRPKRTSTPPQKSTNPRKTISGPYKRSRVCENRAPLHQHGTGVSNNNIMPGLSQLRQMQLSPSPIFCIYFIAYRTLYNACIREVPLEPENV